MVNEDRPLVTMDVTQDPYQLLAQLGISAGSRPASRLSINNIVGADLTRLDMPQMLEVLRSVYERKGNKLVYRPRTFRVSTQSGALTDIQASLFKRFQTDQEEINRLLDFLTPLKPDADEEDCDAIRALVRDDIDELVIEAGWPGGPREAKISEAFRKCNQHLSKLKNLFGLNGGRINTASEAENWSRYVIIDELVSGLEAIYKSLDVYLNRQGPESFGNQIVWLTRTLKTLDEKSVRLQFQLRAHFVGPEELATKLIPKQNITIAELLAWTVEVCDKGALISTRVGRSGFTSIANDLAKLKPVYNALTKPAGDTMGIPEVDTDQIQKTIKSIGNAIDEAIRFARSSSRARPSIDQNKIWLTPRQEKNDKEIPISIYGPDLRKIKDDDLVLVLRSSADPKKEIRAMDFERIDGKNGLYYRSVNLAGLDPGKYHLIILNKNGDEVVKVDTAFEVT